MAGVKGRSGRRPVEVELARKEQKLYELDPVNMKAIVYQVKYAAAKVDELEAEYQETGVYKPLPKDIADNSWKTHEYIHGKPKQAIEQKMELEISLNPDQLAKAIRKAQQEEKELLDEGFKAIE